SSNHRTASWARTESHRLLGGYWIARSSRAMTDLTENPALPPQQPLRHRVNQEGDEAADQGAADANGLQVLTELQIQPGDEGRRVPRLHHVGDEGADLGAPRRDRAPHEVADPGVDLVLDPRVFADPAPGAQKTMLDRRRDRVCVGRNVGGKPRVDLLPDH